MRWNKTSKYNTIKKRKVPSQNGLIAWLAWGKFSWTFYSTCRYDATCSMDTKYTGIIMETHCRNGIFFRKFETKDMEHKGQFCRQLLHINPLASSLCSHCCPLFLQPFPLIIDHRHSSRQVPTAGHKWKTTHHLHSYLRCISENLFFFFYIPR